MCFCMVDCVIDRSGSQAQVMMQAVSVPPWACSWYNQAFERNIHVERDFHPKRSILSVVLLPCSSTSIRLGILFQVGFLYN